MTKLDPNRLNSMLAELRARKAALPPPPPPIPTPIAEAIAEQLTDLPLPSPQSAPSSNQIQDRYGNLITLNSAQSSFVSLAASGRSCVLIGAAGTGKTTCQKAVVQALELSGRAGVLSAEGHKYLQSGTPGIVICAYTRRAAANIRKNLPTHLQSNCITIHKLLEYQPVYNEVDDPITGETRTKMAFEATRNANRVLPESIHTIIFEESSMLGTNLHQEVIDAAPHGPQIIYLGDIQQLPPVFGPAILGFKLLELPVVELTEVYRQALESPIISLAHRILSGNPILPSEFDKWKFPGQLTIRPWKKSIDSLSATLTLGATFIALETSGAYDPEQDIILIPFNKACGTDEINRKIANHLARKSGSMVHQIIAGFNRVYFREGEKILYDKEDATILSIEPNPSYFGVQPMAASTTLDYWGYDSATDGVGNGVQRSAAELTDDDVDFLLGQVALQSDDKSERVKACSHLIRIKLNDTEQELTVSAAGDVNSILYGYALTVHKAQGSEWRRVFFCLHQSHNTMVQRELLYTAVTRAREELYIICEPDSFIKGINGQRVKGNTLEEKAEFFKGKQKPGM